MSIQLPVECASTRDGRRIAYRTVTRDISSDGVCFETDGDEFPVGAAIEMELGVPPGDGYSPYSGRVRGIATVTRVDRLIGGSNPRFRVSAHFGKPLKLVF